MTGKKTSERMDPVDGTAKASLVFSRLEYAYMQALNECGGSPVIDLGCGNAWGTKRLSKKTDVFGIDIDHVLLKKNKRDLMLDFICADLEHLPLKKGSISCAVCIHVIEHLKDAEKMIESVHDLLVEGGKLIVSTPNRQLRLDDGQNPWNKYHKKEYSPKDLEMLLGKYFSQTKVLGVFGCERLQKAEKNRLAAIRQASKLDILGLRHRLPESIRYPMANAARKILGDKTQDRFTTDDYLLKDDPTGCIDILAIARK